MSSSKENRKVHLYMALGGVGGRCGERAGRCRITTDYATKDGGGWLLGVDQDGVRG